MGKNLTETPANRACTILHREKDKEETSSASNEAASWLHVLLMFSIFKCKRNASPSLFQILLITNLGFLSLKLNWGAEKYIKQSCWTFWRRTRSRKKSHLTPSLLIFSILLFYCTFLFIMVCSWLQSSNIYTKLLTSVLVAMPIQPKIYSTKALGKGII